MNKEIKERKLSGKKLSKYVAGFDYIDKILIVLSVTSGGVIFSLTTGIIKKLLSITINKKKQNNKILVLAKSKLNSIETLVSQALPDMEISHEEFITILNAERKIWKNERKSSWMMCEFRLKIRYFK